MRNTQTEDDIIIIDDKHYAETSVDIISEDKLIVDENDDKFKGRCRIEDDQLIVVLNKPFTCRYMRGSTETTEETSEIRFRRANGGDLRAIGKFRNEEDKTFHLFLRLSGLVEGQYNKIDYIDLQLCMEAIDHFLLTGPETGKS